MIGQSPWVIFAVAVFVIMGVVALPVGAPAAGAPALMQTDLRVLVISNGNTLPIEDMLSLQGVPFTRVVLGSSRPTISAAYLAEAPVGGVPRAKFQAVVIPDAGATGLTAAERTALNTYLTTYGIRQLSAYDWPSSLIGLNAPTYSGKMDGKVAQVTTQGLAGPFKHLAGPVPFDDVDPAVDESYGYVATALSSPPAGESVEPLVTVDGGVILGIHRNAVRENMFLTFAANSGQVQMKLLGPGIVEWLTNGTHLGLTRNYLSVHVDDVFNADSRWSTTRNCTPGEDCTADATPEIRMVPSDVAALTGWQSATGLALDMAFNGAPSVSKDGTSSPTSTTTAAPRAGSLSAALLAAKSQLRWVNHTYDHVYYGCTQVQVDGAWGCASPLTYVGYSTIYKDIADNVTWAGKYQIPMSANELVSGEHSGLKDPNLGIGDNPAFVSAINALKITVVASDNSKESAQRAVGGAVTLPRYPNSLYYNVATKAEAADEYNWIYGPKSEPPGEGNCTAIPGVTTCMTTLLDLTTGFDTYIAPFEARQTLGRVLNNDPRPHFTHQSNLAEDGLVYAWLDQMLTRYDASVAANTPIVQPTMTQAALVLTQQKSWKDRMAAVSAYAKGGQVVVTNTGATAVWVPLSAATGTLVGTATPFGEAYMGTRSAWTSLAAGASMTIDIAPNLPPTAAFTVNCTADPTCTFTSTSTDTDGTVQSYAWNFGDGTTSTTGPVVSHTYASRGTFTVTLSVTDNRAGASAPATAQVTIAKVNAKPTAAFTVSCTDLVCTVDGSGSADPDGDPITKWAWTFGDGSAATGKVPPAHAYPAGGTYTITLQVTDSMGAVSDPVTKSVTVAPAHVNSAPSAAFTATCVDLTCGFNASASTDADGSIVSYQWTFGDGTGASGVNPLGHVFPGAGTYSVTLTVQDDDGATGTSAQPVTVTAASTPVPAPAPAPAPVIAAPAPAPVIAAPVAPVPTIKVKAVNGKGKLKVDVNPNKGKGYWKFKVQRLKKNGKWSTYATTYKTQGAKETRTLNFRKGTYRVVVLPKYGYGTATSKNVVLKK